jgi:hypothetical protein
MAEKVQLVLDRASMVLNDPQYKRWALSERVTWLNAGVKTIASLHPRVSSLYATITLVDGSRQSLSQDTSREWMRLYEPTYNMAGAVRGSAVRLVPRAAIDNSFRSWARGALAGEVKEACVDERNAMAFDVYPPARAGVQLEIFGAIVPPAVGALNPGGTALVNPNEQLPISGGFEIALTHYVLAWCFAKDASDAMYLQRAQLHQEAFNQAVGSMANDAAAPK